MSSTRIYVLAAIVAFAAAVPAAALAAERPPAPSTSANGIIAILIGMVKGEPFTPPIGTNHGS